MWLLLVVLVLAVIVYLLITILKFIDSIPEKAEKICKDIIKEIENNYKDD